MGYILEVNDIHKSFGGVRALQGVSFKMQRYERLGLIGPNGAGKTTLFNVISGFLKPDKGRVIYEGKDITGLPPHKIARMGIARTFQIVRPLSKMKVIDNVIVGALIRKNNIDGAREKALEVLEIVGLYEKRDVLARDLNLVEKKKLELARALATDPELMLLDEIAAGLRPKEVDALVGTLKEIARKGISIIMVEHVMRAVMNFAERIIVLHYGKKIAEGTPEEIANNELVIKAYLGEKKEVVKR